MPPIDDDYLILVCACGKRLKAPGATPGRVGRCPTCGGTLRAPGDEPEPRPAEARRPRPRKARDPEPPPERPRRERPKTAVPLPLGASGPGEGEHVNPTRSGFLDPGRRAELLDAARQVGRGGILRLPRKSEAGIRDALLYPIWDAAGLSWMAFLSLPLMVSSLCVFGLIPIVLRGGNMAILGPFAFPMIVVLLFALGYLTQVFSAVLIASAADEVHHPKWPEIDFGAIVSGLFQWLCGLIVGLGLGSVPALYVWGQRDSHGAADRILAVGLLATGLVYGLMSLASLVLHGDILALNPLRVIPAIFRGGVAYLKAVALGIVAAMLVAAMAEWLSRFEGFFLLLMAAWFAWAVTIYLGLVVARALGMVIHSRAEALAWFPTRPRWGASSDGIDPTLFEESGRVKPKGRGA